VICYQMARKRVVEKRYQMPRQMYSFTTLYNSTKQWIYCWYFPSKHLGNFQSVWH
jgi:hypothetical protein